MQGAGISADIYIHTGGQGNHAIGVAQRSSASRLVVGRATFARAVSVGSEASRERENRETPHPQIHALSYASRALRFDRYNGVIATNAQLTRV